MNTNFNKFNISNQDKKMDWVEVAALLLNSEATGKWSETHKSFTDWLFDVSKKISLSQSSLWRYYRTGKFYEGLYKTFLSNKVIAPEFSALPPKVSPESLEILEKIERVAPKETFLEIAKKVINQDIKRDELRLTWIAYRTTLDGKTSRGIGVERPTANPRDPKQISSIKEAQMLICLNSSAGKLLLDGASKRYEVIPNFQLKLKKRALQLDALIAIQKDSGTNLELHGVEIKSTRLRQDLSHLKAQEDYCDYIWIALCESIPKEIAESIPSCCGILELREGKLEVVRHPKFNAPKNKLETLMQVLSPRLKP